MNEELLGGCFERLRKDAAAAKSGGNVNTDYSIDTGRNGSTRQQRPAMPAPHGNGVGTIHELPLRNVAQPGDRNE